jgi:hypothetical protein
MYRYPYKQDGNIYHKEAFFTVHIFQPARAQRTGAATAMMALAFPQRIRLLLIVLLCYSAQ